MLARLGEHEGVVANAFRKNESAPRELRERGRHVAHRVPSLIIGEDQNDVGLHRTRCNVVDDPFERAAQTPLQRRPVDPLADSIRKWRTGATDPRKRNTVYRLDLDAVAASTNDSRDARTTRLPSRGPTFAEAILREVAGDPGNRDLTPARLDPDLSTRILRVGGTEGCLHHGIQRVLAAGRRQRPAAACGIDPGEGRYAAIQTRAQCGPQPVELGFRPAPGGRRLWGPSKHEEDEKSRLQGPGEQGLWSLANGEVARSRIWPGVELFA